MSILAASKINQLLQLGHKGGLYFAKWLNEQGYSPQLINRYRSSGWLSALGLFIAQAMSSPLLVH